MKTDGSSKTIIKVATQEQQENAKNTRKTLKVLQNAANDKENLAGRMRIAKDAKSVSHETNESKRKTFVNKAVQTGEATITADDLTSEEPSVEYWKQLAEKRGETLNDSLQEVERLKEHIEALEEENRIYKDMHEQSKHLVEVLQEMVGVQDTSTEIAEEATEIS